MKFESRITISFDEADPEGILFFGNLANYYHRIIEEWCHTSGFGWDSWFANENWGVPIRHMECDFQGPLFVGKSYKARLEIVSSSQSTVQFKFQCLDDENKSLQTVTAVHVFVDRKTRKKINIPEEIKQKLQIS